MFEFVHRYAGQRAQPRVPARPAPGGRLSALAASACGRLVLVAPVLTLLWAGVYWALA